MKIKKYFFITINISFVAIYLRITHKISPSTFGLIGLIFATIGFIRNQFFDTSKTEEKPISDLKEHFNPIKKRYNYVFMILGIFYLFILIFSILGQF